jgi:dTDP-4-dehydrorhamnose reductase
MCRMPRFKDRIRSLSVRSLPQRILIVGGDGTIGGALKKNLVVAGHNVVATTRHRDRVTAATIFLDLAEPHDELPRVDVAVICAAMTRFSDCRNLPELARKVNVTAPVAICGDLVARGTRVILLSTCAVFDCLSPHVDGGHRPDPRSIYGRLNADAEQGVLSLGANSTVLRLTKVLNRHKGIMARWISELRSGQSVQAFDDHRFCPITIGDAIEAITALVERGEQGIYQISGSADISFADAAWYLAGRLGASMQQVIAVRAAESGVPIDEIAAFTSLDTNRLSGLTGYVPLPPRAVIDDVFADAFPTARAQ